MGRRGTITLGPVTDIEDFLARPSLFNVDPRLARTDFQI